MKKQQKILKTLRNAVVLALVFVLSTEPILVAAQPQPENLRAQAIDLALQGGDRYLDSASKAVVESAELLGYLNVIQATPIDQISESYISDVITRALSVAEQSSIALGAVDDVADGVEQLGGVLPAAIDIATEAGIPEEMRADLIALGIPAEQVDQISAGASSLYSSRQAGMSAQVQADLLSFGFTQTQIDEIALAVSQRGLVNPGLDTRMAQFRSTQDELADTRSGMLVLAVQMLGYQIAARQANGIAPRVVTEAEVEELAQDELRLLVHAAHLNAMWGSDPDSEIGEGDWWFIEHYAGRSAERLQNLIVDSQNRGLVAELFVIHQMKMLAVSARTGDAEYAKAELDSLAGLLASRLNTTAYYEQRLSAGLVERLWSQLTTAEALRGEMEWTIPQPVAKNAVLVSMERLDSVGVENLVTVFGQFEESNEVNNTNGILIVAGLSFFDQLNATTVQVLLSLGASFTNGNAWLWLEAIMTGETDNPALLVGNVILGFIPVLNIISDIWTLLASPGVLLRAVAIVALICDIGSTAAFLLVQAELIGLPWIGRAAAAVIGTLARANAALKLAYEGMKLGKAVDTIVQFLRTAIFMIGDNVIGHSLGEVIGVLDNILRGALKIWDNFSAFAIRAEWELIVKLGINEGSLLTGRVIRSGVSLTDEALVSLKYVADDLIAAGADLSDDAVKGLGNAASMFEKGEFENFINALKSCSVGGINGSFKLASPAAGVPICDTAKFKAALELVDDTPALRSFAAKVKGVDVAEILKRFHAEPAEFKLIIDKLGPFVERKTINAAIEAGRVAGVGGPEALRAIAGWGKFDDLVDGTGKQILKNPYIASDLAARAGTDAIALTRNKVLVQNALRDGYLNTDLINIVTDNSVNSGGDSFVVLGKWAGLDKGYAKKARDLNATYWYPHPEIWDDLKPLDNLPKLSPSDFSKSNREWTQWLMDETAIAKKANSGITFKYTLDDTPSDMKLGDQRILNELVTDGNPGTVEFEKIIRSEYPIPNAIPDRMKELQILIERGYKITIDASGLYIFYP